MPGDITIPADADQKGKAIVKTMIGHVVIQCSCPQRTVLVLSLGLAKAKCPTCGIERGIKKFGYMLQYGPDGVAIGANVDVELDEPKIQSSLVIGGAGRFQS